MDKLKEKIIEIGDREEATDVAYFFMELNKILGKCYLHMLIGSGYSGRSQWYHGTYQSLRVMVTFVRLSHSQHFSAGDEDTYLQCAYDDDEQQAQRFCV